jgi:cystathionine beta-lyase/cystathionine gamma-synthase
MESNSKESSIIGLMDLTKISGNNSCEEDENKHPLMEFSTKAIHTHLQKDQWDVSTSVAPPITLSATYLLKTPEEIPGEWLYGRYGNPSRDQVELTLAAIEGDAKHALCFSSGMAAANAMLEATLGHNSVSGDHVVAIRQVKTDLETYRRQYH